MPFWLWHTHTTAAWFETQEQLHTCLWPAKNRTRTIWKSLAHVKAPEQLRRKLDDKAHLCRFLGYTSNGYLFESCQTGKQLKSRDATFHENILIGIIIQQTLKLTNRKMKAKWKIHHTDWSVTRNQAVPKMMPLTITRHLKQRNQLITILFNNVRLEQQNQGKSQVCVTT